MTSLFSCNLISKLRALLSSIIADRKLPPLLGIAYYYRLRGRGGEAGEDFEVLC